MPWTVQLVGDHARERAMLAVRMRRRGEHEAGTAIAELRLQALAQTVRDLIVGGERVAEPRDPRR